MQGGTAAFTAGGPLAPSAHANMFVFTIFKINDHCTKTGLGQTQGKLNTRPSSQVIQFGKLPITQLAMDYNLIENYAGGLIAHDNDGSWREGKNAVFPPRFLYQNTVLFPPLSSTI